MTLPLPRPRAVLFDLYHTLANTPPTGGAFGPPMAETLGMPHAKAELERCYHVDDVLGRCVGTTRDPHDIVRRIARGIDPTVSEERIATALANRQRRVEHALTAIEPAFLAALDRLRAAGIRTALVSDAGADDVHGWERSPLVSRLDAIVFSYELGFRKPDRRIYEHALRGVATVPQDALFVGDGGSDEHRGARAVGMRTVLVTRLLSSWQPDAIPSRRPHVDWEFEDVAAFVEAMDP